MTGDALRRLPDVPRSDACDVDPRPVPCADHLYLATLAEAHARLQRPLTGHGTLADVQPAGRTVLDRARLEAEVAGSLHTLVGRSATAPKLTVRVRAAKTAAFRLGWLLQVDPERLVTTVSTASAAAARSEHTWQTLPLYREPYVGAVLVLAALGLDIETMLTLPGRCSPCRDHAHPAGSAVATDAARSPRTAPPCPSHPAPRCCSAPNCCLDSWRDASPAHRTCTPTDSR